MKIKTILFVMLSILYLISGSGYALYDSISIQGKLLNSSGDILEGTYNFSFNIYDAYTGGTSLYESNQTLTTDSGGIYNAVLDNVNLVFDIDYYLGININDTGELTPRINMTSVGNAIRSNETEYFNNQSSDYYLNSTISYRLESWDNFTGIPLATPSNGDITHLSTANQIYDWVISLNYKTLTEIITSIGNWSSDKGDYYTSTETDTAITNANTSMKNYVDSQDTAYNDSLKSYTDAQDVIYNDSMKSYVDSQDTAFNTSLKDYVDGTFITQANEGNLNVNHSNSTDYWDDIETADDFVNITASGIIKGQPMTGGVGSGVIDCSENLDHCGCSNITINSGLEVHYPEFKIRVVKTDGTEIHCSISEGDINVTDNQHSTYYLNSSCEWNSATFANFHNEDMHPGGRARIFDVLAVNGVVEEVKGNTLLYLAKDKSEQVRIFCPSTSHLTVCNGFDITTDTFPSFNVSSGNSVYLNTYLPTDAKSTLLDETHLTHHENGNWTHTNVTGFNITHCDNGTDLVECTGTVFRQYPVYSISWNSDAIIHMLSPLTSGTTYTALSACKEGTPDYTLPDMEEYVGIVHHIYCARRTDSVWDSNAWVDLRVAPVGAGGSPDLSIYLVEDGTRPLTANWNQGAYNLTNTLSWFLGKVDWSTIQNKFITATDNVYIYMSGTTATFNMTALINNIGNWSADKASYWDTSTDLDTVVSADEISEGKIAFSTACAAGNHYYLNGNDLACEADANTVYDNSSPISLSGTTFGLIVCGDTEIYKYNDTASAWECEPDATAESGMASWVLAASDTAGSESITDGETVTFADDNKYLNATRSTNTITYTLYEEKLNETIEAFGYSTTTGTVTSVATDDTYLTGGAITSTGTITFNTTLAGTSLAVNESDNWDGLGSPSDINAADITDDGTYRLQSWDNFTGIPHATPSNGDVTHFSWADEIYDWVIGLGYTSDVQLTEEQVNDYVGAMVSGNIETLITVTYNDTENAIDFVVDNDLHNYDWTNVVDADIPNAITVTGYMQDSDINTFTELQSWVSDKTLVNEEDIATIDANWVNTANPWDISTETNLAVGNGITLTGDTLTVVGGTALTADAGGLSVTANAIGDTQLEHNTGQGLTISDTPEFEGMNASYNNISHVDYILFEDGASYMYDNDTCLIIGRT